MVNKLTLPPTPNEIISKINEIIDDKQDTLVSGTNIKTINGTSLLGSGNIDIQGGGGSYTAGNGIDITANTVSVKAGDGTIDVDTNGVKVGTIQTANITANAVTTAKIASGAVTTAKIANGAVSSSKLSVGVNNNLLHKATAGNGVTITAGTSSAAAVIALDLETTISASSSNTKAPSAKAVYNVLGDIESAINTIRGV